MDEHLVHVLAAVHDDAYVPGGPDGILGPRGEQTTSGPVVLGSQRWLQWRGKW